jgi:hypothetical protein
MLRIREFEDMVGESHQRGLTAGSMFHLSVGEEGAAAGIGSAMKAGDYFTTHHRGHMGANAIVGANIPISLGGRRLRRAGGNLRRARRGGRLLRRGLRGDPRPDLGAHGAPHPGRHRPLGKARVHREGSDVTIVTYSRMVFYAEAAAEKLAARITEVTFRDLTAPVLRITAKDVAVLADSMDEC